MPVYRHDSPSGKVVARLLSNAVLDGRSLNEGMPTAHPLATGHSYAYGQLQG
jgi:hypothetical protein